MNYNGSQEKLIVAGPSMGALIAQYAIAEMEEDSENHNVALFISFDGPHKGANIPIGMQKALKYFSTGSGLIENRIDGYARTALGVINTPAARQMLINHYKNSGYGGAPNFRNVFQNELDRIGFPINCNNVAILNGTNKGNINHTPGTNMAYIHFSLLSTTPIWDDGFLRRTLWIKNSSNSGSNLVFRFLKENWWGAHTQADINNYSYTPSYIGSLDNAPGGYFDLTKYFTCNDNFYSFPWDYLDTYNFVICNIWNNDEDKWIGKIWNTMLFSFIYGNFVDPNGFVIDVQSNFNFVPSKSAIAYQGSNSLLSEDWSCRDLTCSGETPFDSYFVPDNNTEHASLHQNSVNWLFNVLSAIDNNTQLPSPTIYGSPCYNIEIVGNDKICENETHNYSLINICPSIGNITWQTSTGLNIIQSNNNSAVIECNSTQYNLWIKVFNDNGVLLATKELISKPEVTFVRHAISSYETTISITSDNIPISNQNITSIQWERIAGNGQLINTSNNDFIATVGGNGNWNILLKVIVCNDCGCSQFPVFVNSNNDEDPCAPGQARSLMIEPINNNRYRVLDPCSFNNTITLNQAELFDTYGLKIGDLQIIDNNKVEINNSSSGIKIIKVQSTNKEGSKTIINNQ